MFSSDIKLHKIFPIPKTQTKKAMTTTTTTNLKNQIFRLILISAITLGIGINAIAGKQTRPVKDFTRLDVSGGFKVILTQGSSEQLSVEADDDMLGKIITEVRNGTLIIKLENNTWNKSTGEMTVYLTFVNLTDLDLSGAVNISGTNPMKFSSLGIDASGATKINLNLSATRLDCDFSGASELSLKGNAPEAEFDLSGASNIEALDFVTRKCNIECSGASNAKVHATESLTVEGSGASKISYKGNPGAVETDLSGASKISKL